MDHHIGLSGCEHPPHAFVVADIFLEELEFTLLANRCQIRQLSGGRVEVVEAIYDGELDPLAKKCLRQMRTNESGTTGNHYFGWHGHIFYAEHCKLWATAVLLADKVKSSGRIRCSCKLDGFVSLRLLP